MPSLPNTSLTIRPADRTDGAALLRLAALDSAALPKGPLFIAEVGGELRAAVSASNLDAIADPFHPTAHTVALVRNYIAGSRLSPSSAPSPSLALAA